MAYKPFPKSRRDLAMIRRVKADNSATLKRKMDRALSLLGKQLPKVVAEANKEGLHDIQKLARKNLAESLKASRHNLRTGNLQAAVMDDKYSIADARRLQFMRDELVRPDVPYYRAIEHGDRSQIGQLRPFEFLAGADGRSSRGPRRNYTTQVYPRRHAAIPQGPPGAAQYSPADRIVGPRERFNKGRFGRIAQRRNDPIISRNKKPLRDPYPDRQTLTTNKGLFLVRIGNPVPAYHYAERAGRQFRTGGYYNRALNKAIRGSGLDQAGISFIITPASQRKRTSN